MLHQNMTWHNIPQYIISSHLTQSSFDYLCLRQPSTSPLCWFKFWVLWQGNVRQWRSEDVWVVDNPHRKIFLTSSIPKNPCLQSVDFMANLTRSRGPVFSTHLSPLLSPCRAYGARWHADFYSIEYKLIDFTCIRFNQSISFTHNVRRVVGSRILDDCYTRI